MPNVERKVLTCIKKGCELCPWGTSVVPENCEYKILHVLETTGSGGFHQRRRRSGKTTDAIHYAEKCIEAGYAVAYVSPVRPQEANYLTKLGVRVMSLDRARLHMRGFPPMFVITDEVKPSEVDVMKDGNMWMIFGNHFHLIGFYT